MSTDRLRSLIGFLSALACALLASSMSPGAQAPASSAAAVTFTKDIAPILQKSCQGCHHPDGVAPMSLVTYEEVRPWARAMKTRTALRSQRGAMPPFFVEKNIGIQKFKHDPSLTEAQIAKIATVGRQRRAAREPRRHAEAARLRRDGQVDDRRTGSDSEITRSAGPGHRPGLVGRYRRWCRPV